MGRLATIFLSGAVSALAIAPAFAADMATTAFPAPPPLDTPEEPLEFGTGWYLRGDAAFVDRKDTPVAYAGTGTQTLKLGEGWAGDIGAGYAFNSFLRTDVTLNYANFQGDVRTHVDPFGCLGTVAGCDIRQRANLTSAAVFFNGYVDLGTWYGVTPYVGGGVGVARNVFKSGTLSVLDSNDGTPYGTVVPARGVSTRFAWAAMAGFSVEVAPHVALDFGYRYANMGSHTIGSGQATVGTPASALALGGSRTRDIESHEFRAGVRYMID